jgi:hypothetical protein
MPTVIFNQNKMKFGARSISKIKNQEKGFGVQDSDTNVA